MSYCTIAHVQGLNPQRGDYGASTHPTAAEVKVFILQIAAEIDTILSGRGIAVPVTAPAEFVTALQLGNSQGAAALAEQAMFPDSPANQGGSPHGAQLWAMYEKFKDWLKKGELPAGSAVSGGKPRSFFQQHEAADEEPDTTYDWQRPAIRKNKEF
jgi:hypothetical protein